MRIKYAALGLLALIAGGVLATRACVPTAPQPEVLGLLGPRIGPRVGPQISPRIGTAPGGIPMVIIIGDSNGVGEAVTDKADPNFNVTTTQTAIVFDAHYAQSSSDPPTFLDLTGSLRPYSIGATAGMGTEITLGQEFTTASVQVVIAKMAVVGTTTAQWATDSTYPTVGPNLLSLTITRMHSLESLYGARVSAAEISLGTNDAAASGTANAMQANMANVIAALRAQWPGIKIAWIKTNPDAVNDGAHAFTTTVRTAQEAALTADPTWALIRNDDLAVLSDHLHYTSDSYIVLGQRSAWALLDLMGHTRPRPASIPVFIGAGPATQGPSNQAPVSHGATMDGDIELLVQVSASGAALTALNTPTGWTLVDGQSSSGSGVNVLASVYKRALPAGTLAANDGHTPTTSVVIAGTNPINASRILDFRGPNLNPTVPEVQGSVNNAFSTSITLAQETTAAINELVPLIVAGYRSNNTADPVTCTDSTLTNIISVEQGIRDNINLSDSIGIATLTGQKAAAGATGSASCSRALNSVMAGWQLGIKP